MKKTYHLCLSAGNEIMFRDLEDYYRGFNCFALALYKTGSTGLVESFMSSHTHQVVQTNALHHGVVSIPYAYPHCSINAIFRKEMGKFQPEIFLPESNY